MLIIVPKKENPVYCLLIYLLQALDDEIGLDGTRLVSLGFTVLPLQRSPDIERPDSNSR